MTDRHLCGNCRWHMHEDTDDGFVCVNSDSEYCADWTAYYFVCPDWEERE